MAEPFGFSPFTREVNLSPKAPEVRSYDPTWRELLAQAMMGDSQSSARRDVVTGLTGSGGLGSGFGLLDLTPAGIPLAMQENLQGGQYRDAALAATPFGVGSRAGKGIRNAGEDLFAWADRQVARLTPEQETAQAAADFDRMHRAYYTPERVANMKTEFRGGPRTVPITEARHGPSPEEFVRDEAERTRAAYEFNRMHEDFYRDGRGIRTPNRSFGALAPGER